jgi:hypothetical protein
MSFWADRKNQQVKIISFLVTLDFELFERFEAIAPTAKEQRELIESFVKGLCERMESNKSPTKQNQEY